MLYFAYGSNLNKVQMKERCKDSIPVAKVKLKDYKLVFSRYADIIESKGDVVYGAIYDVSQNDIKKLDVYEGYPRLYGKINVQVEDDECNTYEAFVYVMVKKGRAEPAESYYNTVKRGFEDWDLPIQVLIDAKNEIL